eukprot:scaffold22372_cov19-Tisochrysis_lutea.AAC.2
MHFVCGEWRWLPDLKMPCLWLPTLAVVTRDATPAAGAAPGCSSRVRLAFQTLMESAAGDPVICLAFHTQMQPVAGGPVEIVVACFICFGDLQSGMDSQQRLKLSLEPNVAWIPQNPGRSQLVESPLFIPQMLPRLMELFPCSSTMSAKKVSIRLVAKYRDRAVVASRLRLCSPLARQEDMVRVAYWLQVHHIPPSQGAFDAYAMGNYPYPSSYINGDDTHPLPAWPMRAACQLMTQ